MSSPAIPGNAYVDRQEIRAPTDAWVVTPQEFRSVRDSATGERSERLTLQAPDLPLIKAKRRIDLRWSSVGSSREQVERICAVPGEHGLILWREEQLAYLANGTRTVYRLPNRWTPAIHHVAPPDGLEPAKFSPRVMVGSQGVQLTYDAVDDATFNGAAPPPAGTVWFRTGGSDFRLDVAPDAGEIVFARVVPEYRVFHTTAPAKTLDKPNIEPATLVFLEV
jgi:hypothetical protein